MNKRSNQDQNKTTNYEGGLAYDPQSPKIGLYKVVINNLLQDTFYADEDDMMQKVINRADLVADENPEFVLKLAAYARQEMGIRDVPQLLLAFAANDDRFKTKPPEPGHHNDTMIRDYTPEIIQRMDETATVREMNDLFNGGDPWCLRRGVEDAIRQQENEYILGKYDSKTGSEYTLKDIFNWCHPNPEKIEFENKYGLSVDELSELQSRYMLGGLDNHNVDPISAPNTWQTIVSEKGNTRDAWMESLNHMGHMAKIMNLRNMLEAGLDGEDIIDESDYNDAENSRMFPFRYFSAYRALEKAGIRDDVVLEYLEEAVASTVGNIPDELEQTFAVADTSGSMSNCTVSGRSNITPHEIAAFFAAVLHKKGADVGAFADDVEEVVANRDTPVLEMTSKIRNAGPGGMTNAYKVLKKLTEEDRKYKRVIFLTDDQFWNSNYHSDETVKENWDTYTQNVYPKSNLYNIDLAAYGDLSFPEGYKNVYRINGWNERVIDFIVNAERPNEVISEIERYEPI